MSTIQIPASIAEATQRLGAIERLLTARGWERAAIVAAFVRPQQGKRTDRTSPHTGGGCYTIEGFAALDIAGLRKPDTVRLYLQRWLDAHDGAHPEPGATVKLPDLDWPPTRTGTDGHSSDKGLADTLREMEAEHGPEKVAAAIVANTPTTGRATYDKERDRRVGEMHDKDRLPGGGSIPEAVAEQQAEFEDRAGVGTKPTREARLIELSSYVRGALLEAGALIGQGSMSADERESADEIVDACSAFVTTVMSVLS